MLELCFTSTMGAVEPLREVSVPTKLVIKGSIPNWIRPSAEICGVT
ncbi:MAG: hypothetical protein RL173_3326, partial [Fibrobacterota bacterium]